jgi:phage gp29-like protein
VHQDIALHLRDSDAKQLANTITRQLISPLLSINRGLVDNRRCPRMVFDTQEPEDLQLMSDAVPKLVGMGMRIPLTWAHAKLKIPTAAAGELVLAIATPADILPPAERPTTAPTRLRALLPADHVRPDVLDTLATDMLDDWQDILDELVAPAQAALGSATSLTEFRDGLEGALGQIEPTRLAARLAKGQFGARVWGQLKQSQTQR